VTFINQDFGVSQPFFGVTAHSTPATDELIVKRIIRPSIENYSIRPQCHWHVGVHPFIMSCSHTKLQLDMQTMKYSKKLLK